ncbi:hypothetical protein [Streptomyces sp. SGAir0957]
MNTTMTPTQSPVERLLSLVGDRLADQRAEQCENAAADAAAHIYDRYPDTLRLVVDGDDWRGHPAVPEHRLAPAATAHLGQGLWLVHTGTSEAENEKLRLLIPCACGSGYADLLLDGDRDLLGILADCPRQPVRMPHGNPDDCASLPDSRPATV